LQTSGNDSGHERGARGEGYQTLINAALRTAIAPEAAPVTMEVLRQVLREELVSR